MDSQWSTEFGAMASQYWTPERTLELTGGKALLVTPEQSAPLLRAIGILHRDASMPPPQRRKFFQLNHMLRLIRPPLEELMVSGEPLHLVDAGCGRSYLTLALAWCLKHIFDHPFSLLGIDRNPKLMDDCTRRAELADLGGELRFAAADLTEVDLAAIWAATFESPLALDGVVALHACDTATDDAIALGLRHSASLIAVAPCCQAELARGWAQLAADGTEGPFAPIWTTPHLRRALAETVTDTFRTLLLEAAGYETRAVEFVRSEHTPKNTLIRAMQRTGPDETALRRYHELRTSTGGVGIKLARDFEGG